MANLLLVEDDTDLAYPLSESLKLAGHDVVVAVDGMSALNALDNNAQIDLLLVDVVDLLILCKRRFVLVNVLGRKSCEKTSRANGKVLALVLV